MTLSSVQLSTALPSLPFLPNDHRSLRDPCKPTTTTPFPTNAFRNSFGFLFFLLSGLNLFTVAKTWEQNVCLFSTRRLVLGLYATCLAMCFYFLSIYVCVIAFYLILSLSYPIRFSYFVLQLLHLNLYDWIYYRFSRYHPFIYQFNMYNTFNSKIMQYRMDDIGKTIFKTEFLSIFLSYCHFIMHGVGIFLVTLKAAVLLNLIAVLILTLTLTSGSSLCSLGYSKRFLSCLLSVCVLSVFVWNWIYSLLLRKKFYIWITSYTNKVVSLMDQHD